MPQVSRYPVDRKVEERMFEVFQKAISALSDRSDVESFLHEFLSPMEKIMLAKRLSIAVLLKKGLDYDTIQEILHVSPPTIASVSLQMKYAGSGYKKVVEKILDEEHVTDFWEKIQDALANIPHSKGASLLEQRKKRQKEKFASRKAF